MERRPFLTVLAFLLAAAFFSAAAGSSEPDPKSPFEIVRQLWSLATQGELLHPDGWRRTSGFFEKDEPFPGNELIDVVSNSWAVNHESVQGDNAEVLVGFRDAGQIDGLLRYKPPKDSLDIKSGRTYRLVFSPSHWNTYAPEGKTLAEQKTGPPGWQIAGPRGAPWTTVNTAIRYVLEMREKSTDPATKRNANETLRQLLKFR
jgi:hypothetical protein